MGLSEDDLFFENRCRTMFVVNVLADNDAYANYMRPKGLSGIQILDIIDLFKNVFGDVDDRELIQIADQLVHEGLLVSKGGGTVMNPNPPISVDSEGIKIEIETVGYVDEEVNLPATP
ncbi:MAG: hypothetical protein C4B59_09835 [Candidatus Methanogaster sp.]|uniref:Uncharacterized protein n=1 Tax=Candidatus Methanogaster sp. TaxID=3386292 RepID=A0AC61L232_9EURY|nr:MAG: hypothetical protein C4B59_09835 [ANME-2 cluster archaeon]